jgi:glycosyltransferase involved in cell wall biosynthesis
MKVAHVIASIESHRGGPSRSSVGLAKGLVKHDHEVELLTTADAPSEEEQSGLTIRSYPRGFPAKFSVCREMRRHLSENKYDLLQHHGLWLRPLHYVRRAAQKHNVPFVISPRGMMTAWAWNHRRPQKRFANAWIHPGALQQAAGWHATSQEEADDIRRLGFSQPICIAPNGVKIPSEQQLQIAQEFWLQREPRLKDRKVALFYSRLHNKKRIIELIDLWRTQTAPDWVLLIVGIPDQFSIRQLEQQITREGLQSRVFVFDGTVQPPPYAVANLFLLPSHSENFGLVIAEAMASSVPVLTTSATPWEGLNERNAGWCVDYAIYDSALQEALAEPTSVLKRRGGLGRKWVKAQFTWETVAATVSDFYAQLGRAS